jgi:hypothetical protein
VTDDKLSGNLPDPAYAQGPGNIVKEKYDAALAYGGKSLWQGMLAVGASGFGKGFMVAAALTIAAVTLSAIIGAPAPELELMNGIFRGIGLLLNPGTGIPILAIGGTLGAVAETMMHQNKLSAAQAELLAAQYETARQEAQAKSLEPKEKDMEKKPEPEFKAEKCFVDCEMERRAKDNDAGRSV